MSASAIVLGLTGIAMTFIPDVVSTTLGAGSDKTSVLLIQVLGGLYFGFAMLNWMRKEALLGGIYNRPIVMANMSHFLVAGIAIVKAIMVDRDLHIAIWVFGFFYIVFAVLFSLILYRHPVETID